MSDEKGLPYPPDKGATHWDGCYRGRRHHNCAIERVDRLEAELCEARAEIERLRGLRNDVSDMVGTALFMVDPEDCPDTGEETREWWQGRLDAAYEILGWIDRAIHGPHTEGE